MKFCLLFFRSLQPGALLFLIVATFGMPLGADTRSAAGFVGAGVCQNCHAEQVKQWTGSHHDLAMQDATESTVLGDFADARLTHFGVTSLFYRDNGRFMVRTEGTDGELADFEIKYTFGLHPLQQYLIEFPGGRMQALGLAWDSRTKEQGGQRWFHLYPNEKIAHDDELHWTRPSQNWNSMCAECHSTNLQKNYDPDSRIFSTTWSEIDVSCEACHGPGSDHVGWAEQKPGWEKFAPNKGIQLLLDERRAIAWNINPETGRVERSPARTGEKEIEMCARCHARRSPITADYRHGDRFMDHYLPRRLDEGMYFVDGQMDDEVYVYGSFLQSKMYQSGVTCSDCHEPHSLELRVPGNGVCLQCHQAGKYDAPGHHFHQQGSPGASCAECHMPPRDYMVVDPRHDHSLRVPRPDLSVELGTPNACNRCHQDKSHAWAADQLAAWYGSLSEGPKANASTLQGARDQAPDARDGLAALVRDARAPDILRATAMAAMGPYLDRTTVDVLASGMADADPMVRAAIPTALEAMPANLQVRFAWPLLNDPVRAVRIEAARLLAAIPAGSLPDDQRVLLDAGVREFVDSQLAMAERPEAQANLGNLYAARGESDMAVAAYRKAIALDARFTPAYINLADFYRRTGDEAQSERVLRQALVLVDDSGDLHHALGLSLIRQKRTEPAVEELRLAASLTPQNPRYVYVYAIALNSTGRSEQAIMTLQGAQNAHPNDIGILNALVAFHRDAGNQAQALHYAKKLKLLSP